MTYNNLHTSAHFCSSSVCMLVHIISLFLLHIITNYPLEQENFIIEPTHRTNIVHRTYKYCISCIKQINSLSSMVKWIKWKIQSIFSCSHPVGLFCFYYFSIHISSKFSFALNVASIKYLMFLRKVKYLKT